MSMRPRASVGLQPLVRYLRSVLTALIVIAALPGCEIPPENDALRRATLPPLLQANKFAYHGAVYGGYQISPDGS